MIFDFILNNKMINNLKKAKFLEEYSNSELLDALNVAGIDGKRRGETLSLQEFGNLSNILYRNKQEHL